MLFVKFLIGIIITEAVTEIVVKSELFFPLRAYLHKIGQKISFLIGFIL